MAHWKLTLTYDGTSFHGWQVQPGLPTVQGELARALHRLTGESVLPQGSGRTDSGVHALAQVCSFSLHAPLPPHNLQRACNRILPASIRVLAAEHAPETFHARHSAVRKTYEYRLFLRHGVLAAPPLQPGAAGRGSAETDPGTGDLKPGDLPSGAGQGDVLEADAPPGNTRESSVASHRVCSPFLAPFAWDVRWPLDVAALEQAAALVCGTHDFTSFAAVDPDLGTRPTPDGESTDGEDSPSRSAIRTLFASAWERHGDLLHYRVTGSGFLHHMVRNLVGTLVEIGRGSLAPTCIPSILAARSRSAAGPTAPARGLFLVNVSYAAAPAAEAHL